VRHYWRLSGWSADGRCTALDLGIRLKAHSGCWQSEQTIHVAIAGLYLLERCSVVSQIYRIPLEHEDSVDLYNEHIAMRERTPRGF
jgi:hypothetical protein